ncbi:flavin-containing monooxygenase [Tomitella fengzijianii]|uniref:NAD(P)/FAD-dependent oxidoreductase n=1 Tax=Tomitella fengzijianii TaxID=2597660 RepID=A0A516WZU8_9ACTN|nr:NAD(P)/FAD-dependent oxidoreductase [Tomitella fengzijianii]QDQ96267.1 NAD(P)/FAD-dependent oxidoreductase [Tomitella fengzijianii]
MTGPAASSPHAAAGEDTDVDVVVVGAGVAGMYAVHRLRGDGLTVQAFEAGSDVGGTWHHNRYPGARCDVESVDYSYSFSDALQQEWDWSERYATQPEILRYLHHVADRFDLRRNIVFNTRVTAAHYDETDNTWTVTTDTGTSLTCRFCVFASGSLSAVNYPDIPGREGFAGTVLHTAAWPHGGADLADKRVGVIGTGSSGIQLVPEVAREAAHLTVFQRTPNYSIPAANRPTGDGERREQKAGYAERRRKSRLSGGGSPFVPHAKNTLEVDDAERERVYEHYWDLGGVLFSKAFPDQMRNEDANALARDFAERKIRDVIDDQSVADDLVPTDHPIGTKRIVTDSGYFQSYNRDNVELVNLRRTPIERVTPTGIGTADGNGGTDFHDLDVLIFATGFDAVTGAMDRIDIRGRGDRTIHDAWADGVRSYLGLQVAGFPNLFTVNGPGSPGVLANMVLTSEDHVDWIAGTIGHLRSRRLDSIEPDAAAEQAWMQRCGQLAEQTLFPRADSWYMGANIPGKPRVFMLYSAGFGKYREELAEITDAGYKGFEIK